MIKLDRGPAALDPYVRDFDTFERNGGLGGTDAAALLGLHPYKTALGVYLEKTGAGSDFKPNSAMEWGTRSEPMIAEKYSDRMGLESDGRGLYLFTPGTLIHPDQDWAYGSPDRIVTDSEGRWLWGLEIKTTGFRSEHRWGESGSNKFPQEYLLQCVWYMAITRALGRLAGWDPIPFWDLAVLITGQEYRQYRIMHDQELEDILLGEGAEFWESSILQENPPDIVARDSKDLPRLWPRDDGYMIEADETHDDLARDLLQLNGQIDELEEKREDIKTALKIMIGEAAGIEGSGFRFTWKSQKAGKKVDYKGLVKAMNPPADLVESYTSFRKPARPFLQKYYDK